MKLFKIYYVNNGPQSRYVVAKDMAGALSAHAIEASLRASKKSDAVDRRYELAGSEPRLVECVADDVLLPTPTSVDEARHEGPYR